MEFPQPALRLIEAVQKLHQNQVMISYFIDHTRQLFETKQIPEKNTEMFFSFSLLHFLQYYYLFERKALFACA